MNNESKPQSWWHTLPGVLTAVGATITAIAGLVAVLHQTGLIGAARNGGKQPATVSQPADQGAVAPSAASSSAKTPPAPSSPSDTTAQSAATDVAWAMNMSMNEVRFETAVFQFLNTAVERRTPDSVTARFTVRMTNNGRSPDNFWDSNFRMLIDGVPREPESGLNEVVAAEAAKEGEVRFVIPVAARSTVLRVRHYGKNADIPVELSSTRRAL